MGEPAKWYEKSGPEEDVVVSTHVSLSRNLSGIPFPDKLDNDRRVEVLKKIDEAVTGNPCFPPEEFLWQYVFSDPKLCVGLAERRLVTPDFLCTGNLHARALFQSKDEGFAMMVNGADHLRFQVMGAGLCFHKVWQELKEKDDALSSALAFAFDEELGYLTSNPADLGTGMRASVILHLPAMEEGGIIGRTAANLSRLGLTLQSIDGENGESASCLYELSNQVTLGIGESEALTNLDSICRQLIRQERGARKKLLQRPEIQDTVARSYGILRYARLLDYPEFEKLLSNVRLGVSCGFLQEVSLPERGSLAGRGSLPVLHRLSVEGQPANVVVAPGGNPQVEAAARARFVREVLAAMESEKPQEEPKG